MVEIPALLARWREGDQQAAHELYQLFATRLVALARKYLSAKVAARFDAEDVVQSACRSFFARARDGQFVIHQTDELWRLLVSITLHKLRRRVKHHQADKRNVDREVRKTFGIPMELLADEPVPEDGMALADLIETVLRSLGPLEQQVFELRLQGFTVEDIAAQVRRSQSTVWRVLKKIKQELGGYHEP
jgi:RNA polymerase sigma-70 factor (ECF subfamily)